MSDEQDFDSAEAEVMSFIERLERLDEQLLDLRGDVKSVCEEAKARGYEPKILKKIVSLRKRDAIAIISPSFFLMICISSDQSKVRC